jgi:hypothetical protein
VPTVDVLDYIREFVEKNGRKAAASSPRSS